MRLLYLFVPVMILCACHHGGRTDAGAPTAPLARDAGAEPRTAEVAKATIPAASDARAEAAPGGEEASPDKGTQPDIIAINGKLQDVFYGYDRADLTGAAYSTIDYDAKLLASALRDFPRLKVAIEGHCDERGSAEYNLALGDTRARGVSEKLSELGLPPARLEIVSYGKENPQCSESNESCWQKNRRAHIVLR